MNDGEEPEDTEASNSSDREDDSSSASLETRIRVYALETLLHEVHDLGFVVITGPHLMRLLGLKNQASKMWRHLTEAWIAIGRSKDELTVFKTAWQGNYVLMKGPASQFIVRHGLIASK